MIKQYGQYSCHNIELDTTNYHSHYFNLLGFNKNFHKNKFDGIKLFSFRLLFSILMFVLFSLIATSSFAKDSSFTRDVKLSNEPDFNETTHGSVWLLPSDGIYIEALQLKTDFNIDVSGMIARTTVKQQFENVSSLWSEGLYLFPLPDKAAVDHFRLLVDGQVIEGQIEEKVVARKTYEKAKRNGQRSALVEQKRANLFTLKLANISPGAKMTVEIEYQQTLDYSDGQYSLRVPLVVGERYLSSTTTTTEKNPMQAFGGYKKVLPGEATLNPTTISINMDTGIPVTSIDSPTHQVSVRPQGENCYEVSLLNESVPADRDFILKWQPALTDMPKAVVFKQKHDGYDYYLISVYPPKESFEISHDVAREVVFILDVSGSMAGASIEQAKSALSMALQRLSSSDRFNVIWFNNDAHKMFNDSQMADFYHIHFAKQFVSNLEANGGTEMMPALKLAFTGQADSNYLRQIVFLTDGNVSNEDELFLMIKKQLKDSRLFTVGIGSAPNGFFMKRAAKAGRGSYTFISDTRFVKENIDALLRKLESPALTNIQLQVEGDELEIFQNPIPDLYIGEPITVFLRGKNLSDKLSIKGNIGGSHWQHNLDLKQGEDNSGIKTAWAREKIASLIELSHDADNGVLKDVFKKEIIDVSKSHHLVSLHTSLVAVDVTPVNQGGMLYQERLKSNLPHGWSAAKPSKQRMLAQIHLPQTATDLRLNFILALFFIVISFLMITIYKKRLS